MESLLDALREMEEERLVRYSSYTMIVAGLVAFVLLVGFISAPYGRYGASSTNDFLSGCKLPARVSWMIMECPTLLAALIFFSYDLIICTSLASRVLYSYFVVHYIHRSLIFPLRMKAGSPMPIFVSISAFFYCSWNGLMQATFFLRVCNYRCVKPLTGA